MDFSKARPTDSGILVLDYGSQYTLLIARRLRELGVYAEVVDGLADKIPDGFNPKGLILSGGPDSVAEQGSRSLPEWVLDSNLPVLGICYGMQLLVTSHGGQFSTGGGREYGRAELKISHDHVGKGTKVFDRLDANEVVWMSHGDHLDKLGDEFEVVALTDAGVVAAVVHTEKPLIGLQFHPEVQHSICGPEVLRAFVFDVCGTQPNWKADDMLSSTVDSIKKQVGDGRVLVAVSGGVDSSVAAVTLMKALGPEKVTGIFCDTGLLRKNEARDVAKALRDLGLNLEVQDKKKEFFKALEGMTDPEDKRKTIGKLFIEGFEEFAKAHADEFTHLAQGTLYPDVIESAGHGAGSKVIKSHHNVGGLPERLHLELAEPFRYLFKDEVRKIGDLLGLPYEIVHRHPFPGPGLGIRIPGEVTEEKVKILQEADDIFTRELRNCDFYDSIWQAGAMLLPVKSVGVMGDNRTYQWTLSLRAVHASDGMTAEVGDLPLSFLTGVADKIVRGVDGINRVLYDVTSKPPATIEWE